MQLRRSALSVSKRDLEAHALHLPKRLYVRLGSGDCFPGQLASRMQHRHLSQLPLLREQQSMGLLPLLD